MNLYTYCRNNPIRFIDPSGHITINSEWDWAYEVAKGNITYDKDYEIGANYGETAENILAVSRDKRANQKNAIISKSQLQSVSYEMEGYTISWADISDESVNELNSVLNKYEINTTERIAHFIGQCSIESHCGDWLTELGGDDYLRQFDYYPYYGAGYIQLTWEENYSRFAEAMGDQNIMLGPQYVADNYAWEAAGWFWSQNGINDLIDDGASVYDITQIVRGFDEDTWKMREQAYNATKKALGN